MRIDIAEIQRRVRDGNYLIRAHAVSHALKEGFDRRQMVDAVLNGAMIEEYPEDLRVLICGRVKISMSVEVFLHVVCEYADPVYAEFVTAYLPDETLWEKPPIRRRRRPGKR
ncbi:MAG: DUF4258 domain-containing protein [Blastocatellia bacterium]